MQPTLAMICFLLSCSPLVNAQGYVRDWQATLRESISMFEANKKHYEDTYLKEQRLPGPIDKQFLEDANLTLDACERAANKLGHDESKFADASDEVDRLYKPLARRLDNRFPLSTQMLIINVLGNCPLALASSRLIMTQAKGMLDEYQAEREVHEYLRNVMDWTRGYIKRVGVKYAAAPARSPTKKQNLK